MKRSLSAVPMLLVIARAIATALMLPAPAAYAIPTTFVGSRVCALAIAVAAPGTTTVCDSWRASGKGPRAIPGDRLLGGFAGGEARRALP